MMFCKLPHIGHIANILIANYRQTFSKQHIHQCVYVCLASPAFNSVDVSTFPQDSLFFYDMKWTRLKSTLLAWRVGTYWSEMALYLLSSFSRVNAVSAVIFPEHIMWTRFTDSITFLCHLWPRGFAMPCLILANSDETHILLLCRDIMIHCALDLQISSK